MIQEDLNKDFKQAMKDGNRIKKDTIQLLRSQIHLKEKELDRHLERLEVEDLIIKEKKKRIELLAQADRLGRKDLIEQTQKEIAILESYLPQQMNEYDLTKALEDIINEMKATSKDMGKVIRKAKEIYGNQIDARMTSDIIKKLLNI